MAQGISPFANPLSMMYMVRRRRGLRSAPVAWIVSLGIHAVLFGALWKMVYRDAPAERRFIIPEARLAPEGMPAGEPSGDAATPLHPEQSVPLDAGASQTFAEAPSVLPPIIPDALPVVALPAPSRTSATGSGLASALMASSLSTGPTLAGGEAGASGLRGGGAALSGPGPSTRFFGQGGNAYKVVYVVDASASLMIYIEEIVRQMRQSIRELVPTQEFQIILAKPGQVQVMQPERLMPAIGRCKQQANVFLDSIIGVPEPGKADPVEAMRRAFAVKPELVYFLSDGDYPDVQDELEKVLGQLNAHGDVRITTIGFDPSPKPRSLLERIAQRHGGHFRIVQFKE